MGVSQAHDHFEIEEDDRGINEDDETGVFVQEYVALPHITKETQLEDSPVAQETALEIASRFPKAKKRRILSSKKMYNIILAEGQHLANIFVMYLVHTVVHTVHNVAQDYTLHVKVTHGALTPLTQWLQ